jgi:hypothetical protein
VYAVSHVPDSSATKLRLVKSGGFTHNSGASLVLFKLAFWDYLINNL